jgi:hypothetical protein
MMAIGGDLTRSAQQYDLMDEVLKNITGFGVRKQDPGSSMRFKMGQYAGDIARARNAFSGDIVDAGNLQEEIRSVANGDRPMIIAKEFESLQSNNYRIMSEIYKDVKNLRTLKFSEKEIKDIIRARRAVSKQDLNALMLGTFNSEGYLDTIKNQTGSIQSALNNANKTLKTFYTMKDVIDYKTLNEIKTIYDNIPLGLNAEDRKEYLRRSSKEKIKSIQPNIEEIRKLNKDQLLYNQEQGKEIQKKRKEFQEEQKKNNITQSQAPASMTLPKLDNTMMASMTAGSAGDIDPTTLLTSNETALLSPSEQAYYTNKRRA